MEIKHNNYFNRPMDDHRTYSFLNALNEIQDKNKKIAVDLGCGHCKFTDLASIFFKEVYAIDSRIVRVPKTLPKNVEFIKDNAVTHNLSNYDVIICLGLLYHLTAKEQIYILKNALGKELVIDTHMALKGKEVISDDYKGVFYKEADNINDMMKNPRASTTTLESFWFNESEFEKMLKNIGYTTIIKFMPEHYPNRTFMYIK